METLTLTILGKPVPLARPRFHARNKTYDPQSDVKKQFKLILQQQLPTNYRYTDAPKSISLLFFMPIPKDTPKYKKKSLSQKNHPHFKKPDLDNLIKFILDISNNILYSDDSLITHIDAHKFYDQNPRTQISILDIDDYVKM